MEAGNFTIVGRLGESPLGSLYEAVQRQTGDRAVIRVLTAALSREPNLLGRLQALMRALTRLEPERSVVMLRPVGRDPAQPTLLDCGRTDSGLLYIASEYVGGESLSVQLQRHSGLPLPNKALRIGRQLSACLAVAHGLGIRHQALRPDKILLTAAPGTADGEQVKLLDLGLLDALGRGPRLAELSPAQVAYLAPEQRRGEAVQGGQADVFALGVVLYQGATGRYPFEAKDIPSLYRVIATQPFKPIHRRAPPGAYSPEFCAMVGWLLTKDPARRPSIADVAAYVQSGTPLDRGSTLYRSLLETLLRLGNPTQPLLLDDYRPKRFRLHARLVIDPRYVASTVQAQVTAALTSRFGFARRSFGQPVRSAEVLYTLQSVPGVLGVLLDALFVLPPPDAPPPVGPDGRPPKSALLVAEPARLDRKGRSSGAELLLLELSDDDLEIAP